VLPRRGTEPRIGILSNQEGNTRPPDLCIIPAVLQQLRKAQRDGVAVLPNVPATKEHEGGGRRRGRRRWGVRHRSIDNAHQRQEDVCPRSQPKTDSSGLCRSGRRPPPQWGFSSSGERPERNFWHMRPPAPMKWQKGPPPKFFVKKHHLRMAAPLPRRHMARAAWASAGKALPPGPVPACGRANVAVNGRLARWALPPAPIPAGWRGRNAATPIAGTPLPLLHRHTDSRPALIPTRALIPTLTGVFFRRESWRNCCDDCLHVICNLCCFYLSIRCFDTLFCTVNRLQLSRDRMRRPLTSSPFKGCSIAHAAYSAHSLSSLSRFVHLFTQLSALSLSLIQSAVTRTPSPALSSVMSWVVLVFSLSRWYLGANWKERFTDEEVELLVVWR
jgi:hypothetical protein